jgi:hypothetical protein
MGFRFAKFVDQPVTPAKLRKADSKVRRQAKGRDKDHL